jgi:hypothetical protein
MRTMRRALRVIPIAAVLVALTCCGSPTQSESPVTGSDASAQPPAQADPPLESTSQDGIGVVAPGTPCPGAVEGTAQEVIATSGSPVYLPDDGVARVTAAWRCGDTPVLMFDDVQVSFETGWSNIDVPAKMADLADDYGGSVQPIQGLSAWVSRDGVLMVNGETAIRLLASKDVAIERLTDLASELDLDAPAEG